MKVFYTLLKKEIRELLTPQMIFPFLAMIFVFAFVGRIMSQDMAEGAQKNETAILDMDRTETSEAIIAAVQQAGLKTDSYGGLSVQDALSEMRERGQKNLLVLPDGLEAGVGQSERQALETYTALESFSASAGKAARNLYAVFEAANGYLSTRLLSEKDSSDDPSFLKSPLAMNSFTVVADKQANIDPTTIVSFITSQVTFVPIILFVTITMASQLVAIAIATEKENKTLETLLSSPVSRKTIVASKLLGAGIVSLVIAALYLVGMQRFLTDMMGQSLQTNAGSTIQPILAELGLVFTTGDYLLLALSLFAGILAALSMALILGSLAEDTKSAQGVIAPVMMLLMIPYLLTIISDISTLSPLLRNILYAIPFTHTFTAAGNILLGNYTVVLLGNAYLGIVVVAGILIASNIFSSEKIVTMRLKFGKGKRR